MNDKAKKIWGYVATFFGGIIAALGVIFLRNKGTNADFDKLTNGLQDSVDRQSDAIKTGNRLAKRTEGQGNIISELTKSEQKTDIGLKVVKQRVGDSKEHIDKIGNSISDLEKFIQENGTSE